MRSSPIVCRAAYSFMLWVFPLAFLVLIIALGTFDKTLTPVLLTIERFLGT